MNWIHYGLIVVALVLLWALYTSAIGIALRCFVAWLLMPRDVGCVFTATMAAIAQERGEVRVAEQIEKLGHFGIMVGQERLTGVRVEVRSESSIGYGLLGECRDEALADLKAKDEHDAGAN